MTEHVDDELATPSLAPPKVTKDAFDSDALRFDTRDEAAIFASNLFNPRSVSSDREVGGGIVRDKDGKFYFTVSIGSKETGKIKIRIRKPKSHELVAVWHTHGSSGANRHAFSKNDVRVTKELGVPYYLASPNGQLRIHSPGDPTITLRDSQQGSSVRGGIRFRGVSLGTPVFGADGEPISVRTVNEEGAPDEIVLEILKRQKDRRRKERIRLQ